LFNKFLFSLPKPKLSNIDKMVDI